jgi:hypothetical protein
MHHPSRRGRRGVALLLAAGASFAVFASSAHAVTFSNPAPITINDATGVFPNQSPASSTPYPSTISLSGVTGPVTSLSPAIHGFTHECPTDVDMLLVGPHGQESILMSDAGDCSGAARAPIDIAFSTGSPPIPCLESGSVGGGTYAPTDYSPSDNATCNAIGPDDDVFNPPAPAGPWPTGLGVFNGVDPNGTWSLYTIDQYNGDIGSIQGGWSLDLTIPAATLAGAPSITGNAEVGQTLSAVGGTLGNGGTAAYQWSRCASSGTGCSPIAGATQGTYKPVVADKGHALIVTETGVNSGGNSAPLASKSTHPVGPAVLSSGGTKGSQKVLKQKGLLASIKSNIDGSLTATATVSVPNGAKVVRFKTAKKKLRAGKKTTVKLKLSKGGLSAISNALAGGKKLKAKLTLTVKDTGGGKSTKKVTVRLK